MRSTTSVLLVVALTLFDLEFARAGSGCWQGAAIGEPGPAPCQFHGTCDDSNQDNPNDYTCECDPGYFGSDCQFGDPRILYHVDARDHCPVDKLRVFEQVDFRYHDSSGVHVSDPGHSGGQSLFYRCQRSDEPPAADSMSGMVRVHLTARHRNVPIGPRHTTDPSFVNYSSIRYYDSSAPTTGGFTGLVNGFYNNRDVQGYIRVADCVEFRLMGDGGLRMKTCRFNPGENATYSTVHACTNYGSGPIACRQPNDRCRCFGGVEYEAWKHNRATLRNFLEGLGYQGYQ